MYEYYAGPTVYKDSLLIVASVAAVKTFALPP